MKTEPTSVLLIDDDVALLEMIKLMSERSREMTIQTAQSAKEALGTLEQKSFDVIIVDYDMPEISGIEFLKILRKHGDTTPIIVFTGLGGEYAAIEALNNGANFLLKKGEDPRHQFRELVTMVKKAMERSAMGRALGTTQRIIVDMINFSSDPCFAIDRDGKIVAWNDSIEQLTDVPASVIIGKGDNIYSEPFFGTRKKMLVNLVFESEEEIKRQKYMLVSRIQKGPIVAVTRGLKKDGREWTLWMKAMPVYDSQGQFVASVGTIRDVTATFSDIALPDSKLDEVSQRADVASPDNKKSKKTLFNKILGKSSSHYRDGVILYAKEKKYPEAIAAFDKALEGDNKLAHVWNDRGTCYREMGDHTNALKSLLRAVELSPDNTEYLFNLGETLEIIGVMYMSNKYLDSAIQTFKMVVNQMPNNASAWNHLGICFKEMGKADESKFYFDRARDIMLWKKDTPIKRKRDEIA
ncbi:MAG: response regulator [Methanoregulaceae archaeon]|nr:MAG: response regulator [Methanoregulaceae archaeon]